MTQPYPLQHQFGQEKARPPLTAAFFRLARVVQALLVLTILTQIVMVAADAYYLRLAGRLISTPRQVPLEDLERFDTVSMLTTFTYLGVVFLTGCAFISWLFKAHRSDRMNPSALQHKSFWAIIGWFVPIMNLFRPNQMISDTRRGADPLAVTPVVQPYWWAAFLIGTFGDRIVADRRRTRAEDLRGEPPDRGVGRAVRRRRQRRGRSPGDPRGPRDHRDAARCAVGPARGQRHLTATR